MAAAGRARPPRHVPLRAVGPPPTDRLLHFFELDDETIWGATAFMLVDLAGPALTLRPGSRSSTDGSAALQQLPQRQPRRGATPWCGADREAQHRHAVEHRAREQHARPVALARSISASVASSSTEPQAHEVQRVRGDDLEALVGATMPASRCVSSTWRRIIVWIASTPSRRSVIHSLSARKRRPSGTCQSR